MADDFSLSSYYYDLPEELIAQEPRARGSSRLMALERASGRITIADFSQLESFLDSPCLFVANNSRVIPARLHGQRPNGGKAEFLLLTPLPLLRAAHGEPALGKEQAREVEGLLKPAKKLKPGDIISFDANLALQVLEHGEFGKCRALLAWNGDLVERFHAAGAMPLPPYIRRPACAADQANYQTVYAKAEKSGSVAAPTAGLHFTPELLSRLLDKGHKWAELTLYVGYGTFSPVRCNDIREHEMHPEYVELPPETAMAINEARKNKHKIIAVGTTATRVLEGTGEFQGIEKHGHEELAPYAGWINTFLYPGKSFRIVDKMITNFHLPESTLLMLVSAMAGRENILAAYRRAVQEKFRFFSYGDAMLIY